MILESELVFYNNSTMHGAIAITTMLHVYLCAGNSDQSTGVLSISRAHQSGRAGGSEDR